MFQNVKKIIKKSVLKYLGISLLSIEETKKLLEPFKIKTIAETKVFMPSINDLNTGNELFPEKLLIAEEVYVWDCKETNSVISKHGSIVTEGKVLCTDWDSSSFKKDLFMLKKRKLQKVSVVIAPFAHTQLPDRFGGYYDYLFFVAAKLCRIKDALKELDTTAIPIVYHPFNGAYEKEYMDILGFDSSKLIDSREYRVSAKRVILGNGGNYLPNTNEIALLKRSVESKINIPKTESNRIYISRSGRRRVINEDEVTDLLKTYNFIIIEDKNRSIAEQIAIYKNASFIIGAHGASFANIIWCEADTILYEFFPSSYSYNYFLYLSVVQQMKYFAYKDNSQEVFENFYDACHQNIYVSIPRLKETLEKILVN